MSYRVIAAMCLGTFLTVGCVATGNNVMKDQSHQSIESVVIKNKTTKQEVQKHFGSADRVSFTDSGNEIWTYTYSKSKPMARNFIPYNFFSLGENTETKEMVILFNSQGVVLNYTYREAANQTRSGIMK